MFHIMFLSWLISCFHDVSQHDRQIGSYLNDVIQLMHKRLRCHDCNDNCIVKLANILRNKDLGVLNSFLTESFCGQCRSRSDCTYVQSDL